MGSQFQDIMKHIRDHSDLCWSLQKWEPSSIFRPMIKSSLNDGVFLAVIMKHLTDTGYLEDGSKVDSTELSKIILSTLNEIRHSQQMKYVRSFGYILSKLFRHLFHKLCIDKRNINLIRYKFKDTPVLLLPSHRSYLDFLLVSYLHFYYHLPVPIVAAGIDFKSMKCVGEMMRNAGAFFIRRSFNTDKLYSIVLKKYFTYCLVSGNSPIEFFLEGTRSRNGITKYPKFGLLSSAIETYLRKQVCDILVVPIAIVYDRVVEENLYAYELLGQPKPKESTWGLLKAAHVLKEGFGNVFIRYGDPLYVKDHFEDLVYPSMNPTARSVLAPVHRDKVKQFALSVLESQQQVAVIPLFSLIASILQYYHCSSQEITLNQLSGHIESLNSILPNPDILPCYSGNVDELREALEVHKNIIRVDGDKLTLLVTDVQHQKTLPVKGTIPSSVMNTAVTHLVLQIYVNQMLFHFHHISSILCPLLYSDTAGFDATTLYEKYQLCLDVFQCFMIIGEGADKEKFNSDVRLLCCLDLIKDLDGYFSLNESNPISTLLCEVYSPFLVAVDIVTDVITKDFHEDEVMLPHMLCEHFQTRVVSLLIQGFVRNYSLLSRQLCQDVVDSLIRRNMLCHNSMDNVSIVNMAAVMNFRKNVSTIMTAHKASTTIERAKL